MARRKNNNWLWWVIGGFLLLRHVATGGALRSLFLSSDQIAEMYRGLVTSEPSTNYEVNGVAWHIDMARITNDYAAVMAAYQRAYGRNLSTDLLAYFNAKGYIHLSDYVAELWKNGQVMLQ